ncbi:hypothetical protein [Nonomuraea typhae]|uniref:Uncharacterized protein n=1 Tax=Nonomuraea typhae TaxID=2603600 RepID=A0ABW7Z3N8_9ACTN|nr:hypothetical protein [Nonomuraea typhae]
MLKRLFIGTMIAASAFAVTGTVITTQAASASTQAVCSAPTGKVTTAAKKCRWRWNKHGKKCWYCWHHHHWEKKWCKHWDKNKH